MGEAVDATRTFCAVVEQFPLTEMASPRKSHFRLKKFSFPAGEVRLLKLRYEIIHRSQEGPGGKENMRPFPKVVCQ